MMRSWTIARPGGIEGLELVERPVPVPGPGEVLVKMRAASLNYRDLQIVHGQYPRTPLLPPGLVPLSDGCGEVVELGSGAVGFRIGDRVAPNLAQDWLSGPLTAEAAASTLGAHRHGVLAEYAVFPANSLVMLPHSLSFAEGATLPCAGLTAWNALTVAGNLKPGQVVLVQGTGGVSLFAAQIALACGARVIATTGSEAKMASLTSLGCEACIDYRRTPDWSAEVLAHTGGRGADVIVEVGGAGTIARSLAAVAVAGRISLVGTLAEPAQIDPRPILVRYASITGIFVGSRQMFAQFNRFVEAHALQPIVDRVFQFEDAPSAYDCLKQRRHFGKIVIGIA